MFRPRFPMSHVNIANVCEGTRLAAQKGRPGHIYFLLDKEQPTDAQDFMLRYAATQVRSGCRCCALSIGATQPSTIFGALPRLLRLVSGASQPPVTASLCVSEYLRDLHRSAQVHFTTRSAR